MLAEGRGRTDICEELGIGRTTLWKWQSDDPEFGRVYAEASTKIRDAVVAGAVQRMQLLGEDAVEALHSALAPGQPPALRARAADIVTKRIAEMAPQQKVDVEVTGTLAERLAELGDTDSD